MVNRRHVVMCTVGSFVAVLLLNCGSEKFQSNQMVDPSVTSRSFAVSSASPNRQPNLIVNPGFEYHAGTLPDDWYPAPAGGIVLQTLDTIPSGSSAWSVKTEMRSSGQADWRQHLGAVEGFDPFVRYRLRGHIRASNVAPSSHAIELQWFHDRTYLGRTTISSTLADQWVEVSAEDIVPPVTANSVWVLLRTYQTGTYWFDDIVFTKKDENLALVNGKFPIGLYDPASIELLKNGDFRLEGTSGRPASWDRWIDAGSASLTHGSLVATISMTSLGQVDWRQSVGRIDPSQKYRISGKILASNVDPGSHGISLQWFSADDRFLGQTVLTSTVANSWQSVSAAGISPPIGTSYAWVVLRAYTNGTYSFDDVSLKLDWNHQQRFADVRNAGFNFVTPIMMDLEASCSAMGSEACLDEVRDAGLTQSIWVDTNIGVGGSTASLENWVKTYRSHPALEIWSGPDEAALFGMSPSNLIRGYDALDKVDKPFRHLLWLNHAPRTGILLSDYGNAADIHSIDVYPIPLGNDPDLATQTLDSVGQYTDFLYQNIVSTKGVQRKPIWMVLQGMSWTDLAYALGDGNDEHAIEVQFFDKSNRYLGMERLVSDQPNKWKRVFLQKIIPPKGTVKAWILLRPKSAGTYYFDDFSFSSGGANLIKNPGVEASSAGMAASWESHTDAGSVTFDWDSTVVHSGSRSLKVVMNGRGLADFRQLVDGIDDKREYEFWGWIYKKLRPTWQETRFMAYDAIIHGARGLVYWGAHLESANSQLWNDLKRIAGEIRSFSNILMLPPAFRDVFLSNPHDIETLLLKGDNGVFLIAANRKPYSTAVAISISGLPLTTAFRMSEPGSISLIRNSFIDSFDPYQVRLYYIVNR